MEEYIKRLEVAYSRLDMAVCEEAVDAAIYAILAAENDIKLFLEREKERGRFRFVEVAQI